MRHRSYVDSSVDHRERGGDIKVLASIWPYLKPYLWPCVRRPAGCGHDGFGVGAGLKVLGRRGLWRRGTAVLDKAFVFSWCRGLLAVATYARFYLVS